MAGSAATGLGFAAGGMLGRAWRSYEAQLKKRPVMTQMATSALLWGAGDVLAQRLEHTKGKKILDARRMALTGGYGAAVVGTTGHFWYLGLDALCGRYFAPGSAANLGAKLTLDTAILGPVYIAAFFVWGCALISEAPEASAAVDASGPKPAWGGRWEALKAKMKQDFLPTLAAELAVWPVLQAINFSRVPLRHQLLFVNVCMLLDATFMSWARVQDDWSRDLRRGLQAYATKHKLPGGQPALAPQAEGNQRKA